MTIGVEQFGAEDGLHFASRLVTELGEVLHTLGYETTSRATPKLTSAELDRTIQEHMTQTGEAGFLIVHVLTHGILTEGTGALVLLGSDKAVAGAADIGQWLAKVQDDKNFPVTLFLLDVCSSGAAARLHWQPALRADTTRGWVIAACRGNQNAYEGRFTKAVTHVLNELAAGGLGLHWSVQHVPLDIVAKAIQREVNRQVREDGLDRPQQVTASLVDISDEFPDLPFFPNPGYRDGPLTGLRDGLDPGLAAFADDLVQAGTDTTWRLIGRDGELARLVDWMSAQDNAWLQVVTGGPGSGKSALLRVLVCAAHPALRAHTGWVWGQIAQRLPPVERFAAVHARGLDLQAIVHSLARQLGLTGVEAVDDLVRGMVRLPRPVIVLDGLDEAADPEELRKVLLARLVQLLRPPPEPQGALRDSRRTASASPPPFRLLVALRPGNLRFLGLLAHDEQPGLDGRIDLDQPSSRALEDDLYRYVSDRLRGTSYRHSGQHVGGFATEVARALSQRGQDAFLLAKLYTEIFLKTHPLPVTDPGLAGQFGARVPKTLRAIFDLHMVAQSDSLPVRRVIAILAYGSGQGMPLTVLSRLADLSPADVQNALAAGQAYLHQARDTDGSILYKISDPGLADYLRRTADPGLLDRLLNALGPSGTRNWRAAEPYVLRHAFDHARQEGREDVVRDDPGFLLEARPEIVRRALAGAGAIQDVYEKSLDTSVSPPRIRRDALALNAAREWPKLAEGIGNVPGEPPLGWRPRWVVGEKTRIFRRPKHAIRSMTIAGFTRELAARSEFVTEFPADFEQKMVILGGDHGVVSAVSLATGEQIASFPSVGNHAVTAIRYRVIAGQTLLLLATGRQRQAIDLSKGRVVQVGSIDDPALSLTPATSSLIVLDGLVKVIADGEGNITVQDAGSARPLPERHGHGLTVVACQYVSGRPLAFTGGRDEKVRVWDLVKRRCLDVIDVPGPVLAIEATREGDLVVLAGPEAIAFRHVGTVEGTSEGSTGGTAENMRGRNWL